MNTTKTVAHFTYNHLNKTIDGSVLNFQRAGNPNSPLYNELMKRMAAQPTYKLNPIAPEKQSQKQTYKGLTNQLMMDYLDTLATQEATDLRNKLANMKENGESFAARKKIFLEHFPKFSVNKAKKLINDGNFQALKTKYKIVRLGQPETGISAVPFNKARCQ